MSDQGVAALIGLAVYLGMKLIDALIPHGSNFTFTERWLRSKEDTDEE